MQIVSSHNDVLKMNKEILIDTKDKENDIKTKGIKLSLFEHQKILLKEIIDFIQSRAINTEEGKAVSKNIWIKSDIGTGKTLIFLSLLQWFKNNGYENVNMKTPFKSDIMKYVEKGIYQQIYNENFTRMEILKQSGLIFENNLYQEYVKFLDFKKQSIAFCQNQVINQFAQYISEQTSLTYYMVNSNEDFIEFLIDFDEVDQDVVLWNSDKVDIPTSFNSITSIIQQISKRRENFSIMQEIDNLRQYYKIDQVYSFNTFWIEHINKRQRAPFFTCAYDDFDIMRLPEFQPIPSLFNIFIGSTMIERMQQETNVCSAFIFNSFVNKLCSFRIVPEQLQQILKLPKINVFEKTCKAPSHVYAQFKFVEYLCNIFQIYRNITGDKGRYKMPTQEDYLQLVYGKMNFQDMNQKYLVPFKLLNQFIQYKLQIIIQIVQQLRALLQCNIIEQSKDKELMKMLPHFQALMGESQDNVFFNDIKRQPQKQIQTILNKLCDKVPDFEWNEKEMEDMCIEDIIDNSKLKDPVMSICCGTLFNYDNLHLALSKNGAVYCCNFCKTQIQNVQRNYIYKEEYLKIEHDTLVFTPLFERSVIYTGQTKLQTLFDTLKEVKGKTMVYMEDQIILEKEFIKPQDLLFKVKDKDDLIQKVVALRPRSIERYQQNQDYAVFRQAQERQLEYIVSVLQQNDKEVIKILTPENYKILKKAYVQDFPDAILVNSLKQIIGENMTYIDNFIFFNIPSSKDEYLQIVGRSNRIGRQEENNVYMFYYPNEKKLI